MKNIDKIVRYLLRSSYLFNKKFWGITVVTSFQVTMSVMITFGTILMLISFLLFEKGVFMYLPTLAYVILTDSYFDNQYEIMLQENKEVNPYISCILFFISLFGFLFIVEYFDLVQH